MGYTPDELPLSPPENAEEGSAWAVDEDMGGLRRVDDWESTVQRPWVVDAGSGGAPFPLANILVDKYPQQPTRHRNVPLRIRKGQILILGDVYDLPFGDREVDFIWSSCVMEHLEDPWHAAAEMFRVSAMGTIMVPSVGLEAVIQIINQGENSNGHEWLCRTNGSLELHFLRCRDRDKPVVRGMLERLGYFPTADRTLMNSALIHCWGHSGWPKTLVVRTFEPTDEMLNDWAMQYEFGN